MTPYDQAVAALERGDLRAIDVLVAEHVFGWKAHELEQGAVPACRHCGEGFSFHATTENLRGRFWCEPKVGPDALRRFSEDIAAAWPLLDRFQPFQITYSASNGWFVGLGKTEWCDQDIHSGPLAICLAALKAVSG